MDRSAVLRAAGADPSRPVLVAVGRLVPEKAHDDLLAAIGVLRDAGREVQLVVVGDGPRRAAVEAAAASLGEYVVLAGERSHDEVRRLVAVADVFVSSSTHEGFPLAPVEALALGTPVVATAVGGVSDQLGDAGVLVPPSDPAALARAVGALLDDDGERARLAAAGRERAHAFSVDAVAARLEAVYADAVARRRR